MLKALMPSQPAPRTTKPTAPTANLDQSSPLARAWLGLRRFAWDVAGIVTLSFGLMTLLAIIAPSLTAGVVLSWWSATLTTWFGWGSLWVVLVCAVLGLMMLRHHGGWPQVRWWRVLALEVAAFCMLALLASAGGTSLERAEAGLDGGRIGWALAYLLETFLEPAGLSGTLISVLVLAAAAIVSAGIGLGLTAPALRWAFRLVEAAAASPMEHLDAAHLDAGPAVSVAPLAGQETTQAAEVPRKKRPSLPAEFRKRLQLSQEDDTDSRLAPPPARDDRLPALELLVGEQSSRPDERNINLTAGLIEKTLAEFGIPAKVVGFRVGPTVTQFAVEPGFLEKAASEGEANRQKVRVAQIASLGRDLALVLSAERLRIEAPVPGRPYVGIEVPNARSTVVRLRPILESDAFYKAGAPLAIALGRDVSGQPVVADLAQMPHLLIAGTTGSGKSVCIAAITTCLVMNNTPEDLRLVMIDPKMVELVRFNGLPHLYGKVETDLARILGVLRWTVAEMDRRYRLLESTHSRNIDSYNRKARRKRGEHPLPRIVVIIDELADLMMSAPEQTEPSLVRLAQMARATGIHLVMATQRPSTDVVTGLIKANFTTRISFAVASSVDSRVILDSGGAESLLGHGDMLFLPPGASTPLRCQGVMVSDQEVERVITFWQRAIPSLDGQPPPWDEMLQQEAYLADRDDLVEKAIDLVRETQRASVSFLQRRLRIGYPRAARLIDELEELGVIGPSQGGGRERQVLIGGEESLSQFPHPKHLDEEDFLEEG